MNENMTASPKMPELLPCERCGAKLEISKGGIYDPMYGWKCSECPIQARIRFSTVEEAITHANRRTPPPAPSTPASVGEPVPTATPGGMTGEQKQAIISAEAGLDGEIRGAGRFLRKAFPEVFPPTPEA